MARCPPSCADTRVCFIDTSNKLKPDTITDTNMVFRYGAHMVAPKTLPSSFNSTTDPLRDDNMSDLLVFTGFDNLADDYEPLLTDFQIVDAETQKARLCVITVASLLSF